MHERWETNEVSSNVYVVIPPLNSPHKVNTNTNSQATYDNTILAFPRRKRIHEVKVSNQNFIIYKHIS